MDRSRIAAELRGPLRFVPPLPVALRRAPVRRLMRAATALVRPAAVDDVWVRTTPGPPALRFYRPLRQRTDAALLWIHGGGLVLGTPLQDDARCAALARDLGVVVVSASYRLAPEHPFPAALHDCRAAWDRLQAEAGDLGVDPARVVVGGASAGGGLAACLVQDVHDDPGPAGHRALGQWLLYPMLDDRTAARRELDSERHPVWNNRVNEVGWSAYLGHAPGAATVPVGAVAARREDLTGLPPAWIGVGDVDLFHDEDLAYAERLRAAGTDVTVDVVPGAPHGFDGWGAGTTIVRDFLARADDWLRTRVAPA